MKRKNRREKRDKKIKLQVTCRGGEKCHDEQCGSNLHIEEANMDIELDKNEEKIRIIDDKIKKSYQELMELRKMIDDNLKFGVKVGE